MFYLVNVCMQKFLPERQECVKFGDMGLFFFNKESFETALLKKQNYFQVQAIAVGSANVEVLIFGPVVLFALQSLGSVAVLKGWIFILRLTRCLSHRRSRLGLLVIKTCYGWSCSPQMWRPMRRFAWRKEKLLSPILWSSSRDQGLHENLLCDSAEFSLHGHCRTILWVWVAGAGCIYGHDGPGCGIPWNHIR